MRFCLLRGMVYIRRARGGVDIPDQFGTAFKVLLELALHFPGRVAARKDLDRQVRMELIHLLGPLNSIGNLLPGHKTDIGKPYQAPRESEWSVCTTQNPRL